ncbi:class I SAM-dependent methyltransferase [Cellulomonas soli]
MSSGRDADGFEVGRRETVRYHEELYAGTPLGTEGSWLARPHPLVLRALALAAPRGPMTAYDLGAGVGRHTLPLARGLAAGSHVVAVDLLASAVARLEVVCAEAGVADIVTGAVHDLETFDLPPGQAGLVVGFSAIEHVSSHDALRALLGRCARGTRVGGVHAFGLVTDRVERLPDGSTRPARVELALTAQQALDHLDATYADRWVIEHRATRSSSTPETRDGQDYVLASTLVEVIARRGA